MKFFHIFNFIYKLFSKRGKRALIITLIIVALMFIFTSPFVFASENDVYVTYNNNNYYCVDSSSYSNYHYAIACTFNNNTGFYVFLGQQPFFYSRASGDYSSMFTISNNGAFVVFGFSNVNTYYSSTYVDYQAGSIWSTGTGISSASVANYQPAFYSDSSIQEAYTDYSQYVSFDVDLLSTGAPSLDPQPEINSNTITNGIDDSSLLQHMDNDLHSIDNTTQSIDNRVYQIQVILQDNLNQNEVTNAITSTSQATQNIISSTSNNTQNQIEQSRVQSQQQFNTITNTTTYNNNDVVIDTSFNDITDVNGVDNFIVRLYNLIHDKINDFDFSVNVSLTIPVPFTNTSFELSTEPLQNFYTEHSALSSLITMSWYFVFGVYLFRLAYTFWISAVNGNIIKDTEGFTAKIDEFSPIRMFMM